MSKTYMFTYDNIVDLLKNFHYYFGDLIRSKYSRGESLNDLKLTPVIQKFLSEHLKEFRSEDMLDEIEEVLEKTLGMTIKQWTALHDRNK